MNRETRIWLAAGCALWLAAGSAAAQQPKIPPTYTASPMEVASLPKYCYHQYVDGALTGREFAMMPEDCGYEMNHFCGALVLMYQAQQPSRPKNERRGAIDTAIREIEYTIRAMKPGCYVTADVLRAKDRARMLGGVIPK